MEVHPTEDIPDDLERFDILDDVFDILCAPEQDGKVYKSCLQSPQIFSTTLSRFAPARIVPFSLEKVFRSFCPFDGFVEPFPSVV